MEVEIKDMLSTGAMLIIGVIALKAFGGIQGITDLIGGLAGGIGTIAGGAPGTGAPGLSGAVFTGVDVPVVDVLPEEPPEEVHIPSFIDLIGGGTIPPEPIVLPPVDPEAEPPSFFDLMNPFVRPPPPYVYTPPATYTPTIPPVYQPPSEPDPIMPSDPAHPASDPFLGGR